MKRVRIAWISSSSSCYGGENALFDFVTRLPAEYQPVVVLPEEGPLVRKLERSNIETHVFRYAVLHRDQLRPTKIPQALFSNLVSVFRFFFYLKRLRPDLVHTNNVLVVSAAIASRLLNIPHVWHVREIIEPHHIHPLLWRIWRWIIQSYSQKIICISKAVQAQFTDAKKAVVIWDGIDQNRFQPASTPSSGPTSSPSPVVVGMIGRIDHRRKGQDLFLRAARAVLDRTSNVSLRIIGDERLDTTASEAPLYELLHSLRLEEHVRFTGYVPKDEMPQVMHDLDIVVLYSKQPEGLGLILLEAMACGKPVIAPSEGGPLDIIEHERNGLLVEPRNHIALAEAILTLLENDSLRLRIAANARERVLSSFTIAHHLSRTVQIYRDILS